MNSSLGGADTPVRVAPVGRKCWKCCTRPMDASRTRVSVPPREELKPEECFTLGSFK